MSTSTKGMTMSDLITWTCDGCGNDIGTEQAFFHISHVAIAAQAENVEAWEAKRTGLVMSFTEFLERPEPVKWQVHHEACDPDEEEHASDYAISLHELRTPRQMLRWSADLMGKSWIGETDLTEIMRRIGQSPARSE